MKRCYAVDFWKFLFSIVIVLFHGRILGGGSESVGGALVLFPHGNIAVEFFFIVSGFLMAYSEFAKRDRMKDSSTILASSRFMWKKYKGLLLPVFVSWILTFSVMQIVNDSSSKEVVKNLGSGLFEGLLLNNTGLSGYKCMTHIWYISAMLIAMTFLYPVLYKWKDKFLKYIAPVIAVLFLGYICATYGSLGNTHEWIGITYRSNIRAVGEIALGCFVFYLWRKLVLIDFTRIGRWILSAIEMGGYICCLGFMQVGSSSKIDFTVIFIFALCILITFSGKSAIDNIIFSWKGWRYFGKLSLYMYLNHWVVRELLRNIDKSYTELIIVEFIAAVVIALIMMKLCDCIKESYIKHKNQILKKIIVQKQ